MITTALNYFIADKCIDIIFGGFGTMLKVSDLLQEGKTYSLIELRNTMPFPTTCQIGNTKTKKRTFLNAWYYLHNATVHNLNSYGNMIVVNVLAESTIIRTHRDFCQYLSKEFLRANDLSLNHFDDGMVELYQNPGSKPFIIRLVINISDIVRVVE